VLREIRGSLLFFLALYQWGMKSLTNLFNKSNRALLLSAAAVSITLFAADNPSYFWQPYDESLEISEQAVHPNSQLRYKLLNSKVLDKNDLWRPFEAALRDFSAQRYESLKPLILERSIAELQQSVREGQINYEELVSFYLYRIRHFESDNSLSLNSVITLNPNAINRAQELDQLRQQGNAVANDSIYGMPVLLKDNVGAEGMPTTAGAIALRNNFTDDAFITSRLKANGAIILGKANLSEWAYFFCDDCPSGYSAMGGQTLNPYGRKQFGTGGSSSGSAVAVAANFAVAAVGSETSGSILSPASANSVVGLKPTTGLLSRSGVVPISSTLDTTGPIAKSVADSVILFNAMTGYDENDLAMPLISADYSLDYSVNSIGDKRLGVINGFAGDGMYTDAVASLNQAGAILVEVDMASARFEGFGNLLGGEMKRDLALYLEQYASGRVEIETIDDVKVFNEASLELRAPYGQAEVDRMVTNEQSMDALNRLRDRLQSQARDQLESVFTEFDLDILVSINNRHAGIAALANFPAITLPMGYLGTGQPVGLTLIAPPFHEQDLIDSAAVYEQAGETRVIPSSYQ